MPGHCWVPPCTLPLCPWALGFALLGHSWSTLLTAAVQGEQSLPGLPSGDDALCCWSCCAGAQLCPSSAHGLALPVLTARTRSRTVTKLPQPCGLTATEGLGRRGCSWEEQLWEEPGPLSLAVLLGWESLPCTSAHRHCPCRDREGLREHLGHPGQSRTLYLTEMHSGLGS